MTVSIAEGEEPLTRKMSFGYDSDAETEVLMFLGSVIPHLGDYSQVNSFCEFLHAVIKTEPLRVIVDHRVMSHPFIPLIRGNLFSYFWYTVITKANKF